MWSALELAGPTGALYESAVCVEAHIGELQTGGIARRGLFAFGGRHLLAVAELGAEAPRSCAGPRELQEPHIYDTSRQSDDCRDALYKVMG